MYLLLSDQICKKLDLSKTLKGNPACYAVVLEDFYPPFFLSAQLTLERKHIARSCHPAIGLLFAGAAGVGSACCRCAYFLVRIPV